MNENMTVDREEAYALLVAERFALAAERIRGLAEPGEQGYAIAERFVPFFRETAICVGRLLTEWDRQGSCPLMESTLTELRSRNACLYMDILPRQYDACYGNPAYTVRQYG